MTNKQKRILKRYGNFAKHWKVENQTESFLYVQHKVTGIKKHYPIV